MVQFKILDRRSSLVKKMDELVQNVENLKEDVLKGAAEYVVLVSPVDTGAYMDSHNISPGRSRAMGESSENRPRRQPYELYASTAIQRLYSQIEALPDKSLATLNNNAPHAPIVEYQHGWAPYTSTRREMTRIIQEAVARHLRK